MGGDADAVVVCVFEDEAQGYEGLDVAAGADNVDYDVEGWRGGAGFGVGGCWGLGFSG